MSQTMSKKHTNSLAALDDAERHCRAAFSALLDVRDNAKREGWDDGESIRIGVCLSLLDTTLIPSIDTLARYRAITFNRGEELGDSNQGRL